MLHEIGRLLRFDLHQYIHQNTHQKLLLNEICTFVFEYPGKFHGRAIIHQLDSSVRQDDSVC